MNVGITLMLGFYGICGAVYSEFLKPDYERSGMLLAVNFLFALMMLTSVVAALIKAYSCFENDRVSEHR